MGNAQRNIFGRAGVFIALACALVATGAAAARVAHGASSTTLSSEKVKPGKVIDTSAGRALYLFTKDTGGKSSCSGSCTAVWPPLIASGNLTVVKGSGLNSRLLGKTRRSDGRLQVTYNHHPLYLYVKDHRRGDIHGQGLKLFGGRWYLVSTGGNAVKPKGGCPVGYVPNPNGSGCLPGGY